ncbi:MAG TPA: hypothetical protein VFN64_09110 [Burkholderiaceae bacterium]|nr:hypothetical protein [Burkholderiaceae bacterium]
MSGCRSGSRVTVALLALAAGGAHAADEAAAERALSGALTGFYSALPDQPNLGMAVGSVNVGSVRLEGRYNYEARASASAFVGWKFAGGEEIAWEVTPIIGTLFGRARGVVPGLEAAVAYKSFDFYIEAEYVFDRQDANGNYFYAWSELGWRPVEWLRVGLVGQRTRVVDTDRDIQRGVLLQVFVGKATLGAYAFNPDQADRYATLALGFAF